MRLSHILPAALLVVAVTAQVPEPEIIAIASFPETNPFNHIVNGEKNSLTITVENKSDKNVTLRGLGGSLYSPETDALIKNLTTLDYGLPLLEGVKLNLPYAFYSEYYLFLRLVDHPLSISDQAGDARMELWLEHSLEDQTYRVNTFDSIVVIVEPEISWLDWKMWSTYLVIAGLLGGLSYFAFITFVPQPKKRSKKFSPMVSAPVGTVTATGAGGYQEEWIPEHHLRKGKKTKQANTASGASADELNDGQASTTEGKKRKGRK